MNKYEDMNLSDEAYTDRQQDEYRKLILVSQCNH